MDYFDFDENLIKVTEYKVLGELPDPFVCDDGHRIQTREEWADRRKEICKTAIELQYGTQPPKPEFFKVEKIYHTSYRVTCGTKEKQLSFLMRIVQAEDEPKEPLTPVVDGDLCFNYAFSDGWVAPMLKNGMALVAFDRTELANDVSNEGRGKGPLYEIYPGYTFGALGAWAWGYSRCVDALEIIGGYDLNYLTFTGHSRGGKTCALAGALDERAKIVNPNETNGGSCSCYRVHMKALREDGTEWRNETLRDAVETRYPYWFSEKLRDYKDCEEKLPFDCHYLKAMIAPRILLVGEAASDIWTNPIGTYMTSIAAAEVFDFLGCKENLRWYFRRGTHGHLPVDVEMLVENIKNLRDGTPLSDRYYRTPFVPPKRIFGWKKPE